MRYEDKIPKEVFSTYVEMILRCLTITNGLRCVLHVCGDDPYFEVRKCEHFQCSPRMWR